MRDDDRIYFTPSGESQHGCLFQGDRSLHHGDGPFLAHSSGQLPLGLTPGVPYWVILRGRLFQLASSERLAEGCVPVAITGPGAGLHLLIRVSGMPPVGAA